MKKELLAVILLISILTGALLNIKHLNNLSDSLSSLSSEAFEHALIGDWESSLSRAESASELWDRSESYTHIVLRHSQIDEISKAFIELRNASYSHDLQGLRGAYLLAEELLEEMTSMERIRLGSIF